MAIAATPQTALSVVEGDTDFIGPQVPQTLDNVELTTDFPASRSQPWWRRARIGSWASPRTVNATCRATATRLTLFR